MPGLASDQATLGEVLEVRAEPLNEEELWSVLFESGNALKSVLSKSKLYNLKSIIVFLNIL